MTKMFHVHNVVTLIFGSIDRYVHHPAMVSTFDVWDVVLPLTIATSKE